MKMLNIYLPAFAISVGLVILATIMQKLDLFILALSALVISSALLIHDKHKK